MAIDFTNAVASFPSLIGKLGAVIANSRTLQQTQLTSLTNTTTGVVAQLDAESDVQAIVGSAYIGILNSLGGAAGSTMRQTAAAYANRLVFRDNPRINQTLQSSNTLASLQEIIRQMGVQGATVRACTVTGSPSSFTGVGNATLNVSTKRPLDGKTLENAFSESLLFTVVSDSYSETATEGNEGLIVTGTGTQSDFFAFNWPLGSNCLIGVNAIDGNTDNGSGNILTNSGWESFTGNAPDDWTIEVGAAGTQFFEESSLIYDGEHSLRITGSGGAQSAISQQFDSTTGTAGTLSSQTQYSFCMFLRRDGVAPAAGVMVVELVDENGTVINDQAGTANSFSIDLTALTTVYTAYTGTFRTPQIMPDEVHLRYRMSTALTNGRSIYLDKGSLGLMSQCYVSGPYVAVHAGSIPLAITDYGTIAITNGRGAAGTLSTFQTLLAVLYPSEVYGNELIFPSSNTPSISDSWIA